jgi:hypothetical protein
MCSGAAFCHPDTASFSGAMAGRAELFFAFVLIGACITIVFHERFSLLAACICTLTLCTIVSRATNVLRPCDIPRDEAFEARESLVRCAHALAPRAHTHAVARA